MPSPQKLNSQNLFEIIQNRRSLRQFLDKPISDETLKQILTAGFRAPFAAQLCSVIYTCDSKKIKQLSRIGVYPTTQVLMFFLIDLYRLEKIMNQRGHVYNFDDAFALWLGLQDVSLVVENLILAAEAINLGSVLLGAVPHFADQIAEIFKIPNRAFPVVGLCLGYPDPHEHTEIRPRYPLTFSVYKDKYRDSTNAELLSAMNVMDQGYLAQNYYRERNAKIPLKTGADKIDYDTYSWCEHISRKFIHGGYSKTRLLEILRKHGFKFDLRQD
ncbi:MAG: nitroreductase family protein [Candidatus Thorarchaeota archaeon]